MRQLHNVLEQQRRVKLHQLFRGLRREVGLREEKTSKIFTLKKAVQVIQDLRMADSGLKKKRRRLRKRRDEYLTIIAPASGSRRQRPAEPAEGRDSGFRDSGDSDLVEVVDLLDEMDKQAEDLSGEEGLVTTVTNAERPAEESGWPERTVDSESSLRVNQLVGALSLTASVRALRSAINCKHSSKTLLLVQACQEIQTLQNESASLKSVKTCLKQQRDAFIRALSLRSGQSQQRILTELQHQSAKQKERHQTANQLPAAAGGGASDPPAGGSTDDVMMIPSSGLQRRAPQAPPIATCVQQPQSVLQVPVPVLAPPGVSHNASVVKDRQRTIPNILSRSRTPKALGPAEVLSLVRTALPGQQVLTMRSAGMTTVTLNLPNQINQQQIHLTSLPRPPIANFNNLLQLVQPSSTQQQILQPQQQIPQQILQPQQQIPQQILQPQQQIPQQQILQTLQQPPQLILQPQQQILLQQQIPQQILQPLQQIPQQILQPQQQIPQQILQPQQQILQQIQQPPQLILQPLLRPQQQILKTLQQPRQPILQPQQQIVRRQQQPSPPPPQQQLPTRPSLLVSAGSDPSSDQIRDQNQPESSSRSPPSSSPCPGPSADGRAAVPVGGPLGAGDDDSLTSLLNEIVFLNQQTGTSAAPENPFSEDAAVGGATEQGHAHSPWLLELDSDSDDLTDAMRSGPANGNAHVLAPPPLLQMKLGGAKVVDPPSNDGAAREVERGGRRRREGGGAWRPMPRLVPLGLRGNPPS